MTHEANILSFDEVKARGVLAPRSVSAYQARHSSRRVSLPNTQSASNASSFNRRSGASKRDANPDTSFNYGQLNPYLQGDFQSSYRRSSQGVFQDNRNSHRYSNTEAYLQRPLSDLDRNDQGLSAFDMRSRSSRLGTADLPRNSRLDVDKRASQSIVDQRAAHDTRSKHRPRSTREYASSILNHRDNGNRSYIRAPRSASYSDDASRVNRFGEKRVSSETGPHRNSSHRVVESEEGPLQRLRKRLRSAKANRIFDKTIGSRDRGTEEQGSRPAVYEMKMGATHRKSTRMQDTGEKKHKVGFALPFGLSFNGSLSAAATRAIVACAVVAFAVFMLYPSCQNYYNETRQLQQLQAEYEALNSYNTQMQAQIDYLNTDEGLEDYARSELGWIREDEQMATVEGVESSVDGSSQTNDVQSPLNETISAPDTWYSGFLDFFFGYRS